VRILIDFLSAPVVLCEILPLRNQDLNCLTERSKYGTICLIFDQVSNEALLTTVISLVFNKLPNFLSPIYETNAYSLSSDKEGNKL
jgi:hypothetical protein